MEYNSRKNSQRFLAGNKFNQHGKGKMKNLSKAAAFGVALLAGILSGRAQVLVGGATKPAETLVELYTMPSFGTFWSAEGSAPPLPFDPAPKLPVYQYGPANNHAFIYDDRNTSANNGGVQPMDLGGLPGPGDNTTNYSGGGGVSYPQPLYSTNGLWLEIDGLTNQTAEVVLHPPWNVTNGVYDLYYDSSRFIMGRDQAFRRRTGCESGSSESCGSLARWI
jgi:hypothetical protein